MIGPNILILLVHSHLLAFAEGVWFSTKCADNWRNMIIVPTRINLEGLSHVILVDFEVRGHCLIECALSSL